MQQKVITVNGNLVTDYATAIADVLNSIENVTVEYTTSGTTITITGTVYGNEISWIFTVNNLQLMLPLIVSYNDVFLCVCAKTMLNTTSIANANAAANATVQDTLFIPLLVFKDKSGEQHLYKSANTNNSWGPARHFNIQLTITNDYKETEEYVLYPAMFDGIQIPNMYFCGNNTCVGGAVITDGINRFMCLGGVVFYKID